MTEVRGLCLYSTTTRYTLAGLPLSLQHTTQHPGNYQDRGPFDKRPVLAQHAEQGALSSTKSVLPMHGVLAWNPATQLEREVGEPSLSCEPECLSPHGVYHEWMTLYSGHSSPCLKPRNSWLRKLKQEKRGYITPYCGASHNPVLPKIGGQNVHSTRARPSIAGAGLAPALASSPRFLGEPEEESLTIRSFAVQTAEEAKRVLMEAGTQE